jgi:hexosaminidase
MKRNTCLFFILLNFALLIIAQNIQSASSLLDSLPLIPYPQQIKLLQTDFRPNGGTLIQVCSAENEDYFAGNQLNEELNKLYSMNLAVKKTNDGVKNSIVLTRPGINKPADNRLKLAGLELQADFNPEGYVLLADDLGVIVSANSAAGLYYGMQTLRQLIYPAGPGCAIRGVNIRDWPAMRYRWQQDDWNRGPIPTLDYAKKQVRIISEYKMNGYSIYSENLYESKKHPVINEYGGTITASEINELIVYARQFHVEIIPQQQTFGHLHYILRQERYAHLGEKHGSQILSPVEPESYSFIGDYLSEIVPMFESPFFHIGCDETFELGRGKSKELVESTSHADVYLGYLNKVAAMPALVNKRLLFWGEMALKNPEKLDLLPGNVIAVAWDYLPRDSYDIFLKPYAEKKIPTFVAPAAFYGGRVFPDYASHMKNIRNFVRDGQRFGSMGMMNTSWDDLGEDLFDMGWYGVLYGAACSWQSGESGEQQYRDAFDWAFYRNGSGHQFAEGINTLASLHKHAGAINTEMVTSSPFSKLGVAQQDRLARSGICRDMRLLSEDAYTLFYQQRPAALIHNETIDALLFAARSMDFVFHKAILAGEMSKLYDAIVRDDDKGYAVNTALYDLIVPYASRLGSLRDMTKELKAFHEDLWNRENRPFHWSLIETRYLQMLMEWDLEYNRIQYDLIQVGTSGKHLPREEVGFLFENR